MISNDRAKILFELDKETKEKHYILPNPNEVLSIELIASNEHFQNEIFNLDINRKYMSFSKRTFQSRVQQTIILRRLDFEGGHRNPEISFVPQNLDDAIMIKYIFDKIDSDDDFDNSILIFTRDGFELVNLYSGEGFTSELRVRQIQYSNGELVQILPYWIYRSGEWISTVNTRTQGVKLKFKNFSVNVDNNFNDAGFIGVESFNFSEIENEFGNISEIFNMDVNEFEEISLSSMEENVVI